MPRDRVFIHGKAGVIERADGTTSCFLGSINETKSAFARNYEILWEDPSPEGVAWVEEEFAALWADAYPLPDAIIEEIERVADRVEIRFEEAAPQELPAAAFAEAPIYRGGEQLQPWQRSFVTTLLEHRETYGKARLLLADEVGVGKTLSLAASALVSCLLDDGPVLILCPATLTLQWQVELADKPRHSEHGLVVHEETLARFTAATRFGFAAPKTSRAAPHRSPSCPPGSSSTTPRSAYTCLTAGTAR